MANSTDVPLAEGFSPATDQQWRSAAERLLKGAPFERKLHTKLLEGIELRPLYSADESTVGSESSPVAQAMGGSTRGWRVGQRFQFVQHSDTLIALDEACERELESAEFVLCSRRATGPRSVGQWRDVLAKLLPGEVEVAIATARPTRPALSQLWVAAKESQHPLRGYCNHDPLTRWAQGMEVAAFDEEFAALAQGFSYCAEHHPGFVPLQIDGLAYHSAGGHSAQELGCVLSLTAFYLRKLHGLGVDVAHWLPQLGVALGVGRNYFAEIAKFRAARLLFGKLGSHFGLEGGEGIKLRAYGAPRFLSRRDPWVNFLRMTVGASAAAVGGADSLFVAGYDEAWNQASSLGRRVAINTQQVLAQEAQLGRVLDPAAGSYYVENLSDELARRAWQEFVEIEKAGGMAEALASGFVQGRLAEATQARESQIARRKYPLTGVSEFANLGEDLSGLAGAEQEPPPAQAYERNEEAAAALKAGQFWTYAESQGKDRSQNTLEVVLSLGAADPVGTPLAVVRDAASFEALRDAADRQGSPPSIFLASMGPLSSHHARTGFCAAFFEAGGIVAQRSDGYQTPAEAAQAFTASGCQIACLIAADARYKEVGEATITALKAAGAKAVWQAGKAQGGAYEEQLAGFVYMGCDVLQVLREAQAVLEVK